MLSSGERRGLDGGDVSKRSTGIAGGYGDGGVVTYGKQERL